MKIYSLYILNKAGGLIYQNDLNPGLSRLSANDYLVLAGTLHGVHAIAAKLQPALNPSPANDTSGVNSSIITTGKAMTPNTNNSGLKHIDTDLFSLYIFQSLTGLKFIIVTTPSTSNAAVASSSSQGELEKQIRVVGDLYKQFYVFYCDYVMKNPFYSLDMPIKCAMFDEKVKSLVAV